jgi:hypothetical protein
MATLRPVSPFESRTYRLALTALCVGAIVILLAALLRRSRSSRQPAVRALMLSSVVMLEAYLTLPTAIGDKAFLPQRFAIFAVLFLLAATGIVASSLPRFALIGMGCALVAYMAPFQFQVNREYASQWKQVLDAPVVSHARLGALMREGPSDARLAYDPLGWVGAHYFRRSQAPMLNAPWMNGGGWLWVTDRYSCQFLNTQFTGLCLGIAVQPPPIDLLVVVRTIAGPASPQTVRIAARYGLTKQIWAAPQVSVFAGPEVTVLPATPRE